MQGVFSNPALAKRTELRLADALLKLWKAEHALEAARENALKGEKKIEALRAEQESARARLAKIRGQLEESA